MASMLQLTKISLRNNQCKSLINKIVSLHFASNTSSASQSQVEDLFKAELSSLPNHLQHYAPQTTESILKSFAYPVDYSNVHFAETVSLLKALRVQALLKKINFDEIKDDLRFRKLCKLFVQCSHKLYPAQLVSGLRSLLEIGMSPDSNFVLNINKSIVHQIEKFDITQLVGCLHLYSKFTIQNTEEEVFSKLLNAVKIRLSEINQPAEALMLLQIIHLFDKDCCKVIVEKLVDLVNIMDVNDLLKMIDIQAQQGQRNKPLLTAISVQLQQKELELSIRDTVNILHSFNALNFYDQKLLIYLTRNCESQVANVQQPSVISALLTICGHLKWRNEGLLDECGQWLVKNSNLCSPKEFVSFILTTAALNYKPDTPVLEHIVSCLTFKNEIDKSMWLNVVWSLAVLNHVDKSMLTDVLSPQFYDSLLRSNTDSRLLSSKLKLINLKYILKSEYPDDILPCDLFIDKEAMKNNESGTEVKAQNTVLNALSNLTPKDKFMSTNLNTDMGITIDAEFIINKSGKPLSLDIYGIKATCPVTKSIPSGAKRIALMVWHFKDYTLNEKTLTGINSLALRLLSSQGYYIMEVPYHEFIQHTTEVKKVVYLSQLIDKIRTQNKNK